VNEKEFSDDSREKKHTPKKLISTFVKIKRLLTPFAHRMLDTGFDVSPLFLQPAATIYSWAMGKDWDETCEHSGLAEGDLSRLILRTADNLHHIANLTEPFPEEAESARKAKELIMREPVVTWYTA
jgi:superfamily II RNA helicase